MLYIGMTNDLYRRYLEHKDGIVEGFTKKYRCHSLLYYECFTDVKEAIAREKELTILAESEDAGVYMAMARNGREFFITGHSEYAPNTLDGEYRRDLGKGLPIEMPRNYYRNDNPDDGVLVRWRGHANLMFSNWLNYYVYQETPFDINEIK